MSRSKRLGGVAKSPFSQKYYPNDKTIQKSKEGYQIAQYVGNGLRVYLKLQPDATGNPRVCSMMISIDSLNTSAADRVEMFQAFAGMVSVCITRENVFGSKLGLCLGATVRNRLAPRVNLAWLALHAP